MLFLTFSEYRHAISLDSIFEMSSLEMISIMLIKTNIESISSHIQTFARSRRYHTANDIIIDTTSKGYLYDLYDLK